MSTTQAETRKRVTKRPEERREDILDAALRVFVAKGIPHVTVADITDAAGVAKGTFYLYFDSKEALLGALKERFVDELIAHASGLFARIGRDDWWALADATVESMVDFMLDHAEQVQVFTQEGMTPDTYAPFAECEAKLNAMFATGIAMGVEAGVFQCEDPETTAALIDHAIQGTLEHSMLYRGVDSIDRDRVVRAGQQLLRKVLAPAAAD
jgi:AcrR family transcriptional regulator